MSDAACSCGKQRTLAERLLTWARETHGWDGGLVESDVATRPVAFRVGPHIGYGNTTNEAINACADGLVEEDGWPDDRSAEEYDE